MSVYQRKLLTIITETILEAALIKDIEQLGARGYTITDVRGKGDRGTRSASWDSSANIRIEIICDANICDKIVLHLKEHYYKNYAMITYILNADVLRSDKF
ncbi:MAG: transcriptional regulator [Methylophaga sp.]|nr:MAG: transcriptional regulator [Methylophaga sp.]